MASNPAFSAPEFRAAAPTVEELERMYARPDSSVNVGVSEKMTYNTVIAKTFMSLIIVGVGAAVGWMLPGLALPAGIAGFILGLINIFKKQPSPALVLTYSAVQGVFVGGISNIFNTMWDGIVAQTLFGTIAVIGAVTLLYMNGTIRTSPKMTRIMLGLMVGYLVFSLVNFGLVLFGVSDSMFGLRSSVEIFGIPLGLVLGVVAVFLAVYSLMLDFDYVRNGVANHIDDIYSWRAAFGITLTVIWLYVEILRLLAIARGD